MTLHLIAAIGVTMSAAIVASTLAIGLRDGTAARIRLLLAFVTWFVVVTAVAASGVLHNHPQIGTVGAGLAVLAPIVVFSVAAVRAPSLNRAMRAIPLATLVGVNGVRAFGVLFVLAYGQGQLPAPFAPVAGWGDVLVGITAWPAARWAATGTPAARFGVLIWNSFGMLDLIAAVSLGAMQAPGPLQAIAGTPDSSLMTTLPWLLIPGFLVPLLALTHLAVFYRLAQARSGTTPAPRSSIGAVS